MTKRRLEAACRAGLSTQPWAFSPPLSPPPALESEALATELDKAAKRSSCEAGSRVKEGNQGREGTGGPQKLLEGGRKNTKGTSGPHWSPVCNTVSLLSQITPRVPPGTPGRLPESSRVKIPPAEITQAPPGTSTQGTE